MVRISMLIHQVHKVQEVTMGVLQIQQHLLLKRRIRHLKDKQEA